MDQDVTPLVAGTREDDRFMMALVDSLCFFSGVFWGVHAKGNDVVVSQVPGSNNHCTRRTLQ